MEYEIFTIFPYVLVIKYHKQAGTDLLRPAPSLAYDIHYWLLITDYWLLITDYWL